MHLRESLKYLLLTGAMLSATAPFSGVSANAERVLHSFNGAADDGATPVAGLLRDHVGNLYGATEEGGPSSYGVVFKLTPKNKVTLLYGFLNGDDGGIPFSSLRRDGSPNTFYGVTEFGGAYSLGVVYAVKSGQETLLHTFEGPEGSNPIGRLAKDKAGNFYGVTFNGGKACGGSGCGVVYKLAGDHTYAVLHDFTGGSDGAYPFGGLIQDKAGNFYGETALGGDTPGCSGDLGCGVVFRLAPDGRETVLHSFTGGKDGGEPAGGVIRDSQGNLYGTAQLGGASGNGVVFKITPTGKEIVLHSFTGSDGSIPSAGLLLGKNGLLYGTAQLGGSGCDCGVVFSIHVDGKGFRVLHTFEGGNDGAYPISYGGNSLIEDDAGNLFGTTLQGGGLGYDYCDNYCGTIFTVKE